MLVTVIWSRAHTPAPVGSTHTNTSHYTYDDTYWHNAFASPNHYNYMDVDKLHITILSTTTYYCVPYTFKISDDFIG